MRYAIVSDLHANLRAWNAVLADLCEQRADVVICLGDVVGYGPNPAEVLNAIRSVTNNFVLGNHDAAAVGMIDYSIFNNHARQAIEWTMAVLDPETKQFLSSVPLAIEAGEILFVHAEISEPGRFDYISDAQIAQENFKSNNHLVTFVGHTHLPKIFEQSQNGAVTELPDNDTQLDPAKRYIVNVGSVGEPRDPNDLRARYVIYDQESREVTFRRVEFDIVSYRNDLEATTLALRPFFLRVYEQVIEGREVTVSNGGSLVDMKVSHDSAALVDLGQVASVANLCSSGELLQSARPSRAPTAILAVAAILTLGLLVIWLLPGRKEPIPPPKTVEAKEEPQKKNTLQKPTPPVRKVKKPEPEPKPVEVAKTPTKPTPKPEPKPKPPEPKPKPRPAPADPGGPIEVAWWRMGDGNEGDALVDDQEQVTLLPIENGKTIKPLAPDPVPENQAENSAAKQLGIWQEEKSNNHFVLSTDQSFTFEGWFFIGSLRKPVFLFGTRSDLEDGRGWHLDLRPRSRGQKGESMSFFYDSGKHHTLAIGEDLQLADATAHHFAIVWDHDAGPDRGAMKVYLDGQKVATAPLAHSRISGEQIHPLRVGADFNPAKLGLDELRFTRKSLQPHQFLMREAIHGISMTQSNSSSEDSWSVPGNWEDGKVPSGIENVIIAPGLTVKITKEKPPAFTGSLVLKNGASLHLASKESEGVLPKSEGRLVMYGNSNLIVRTKGPCKLGPIELVENAHIHGGISSSGHHTTRTFGSPISGPGELVLNGVNGNTFVFDAASTYFGGTTTRPQGAQKFKIIAATDKCFGKGRVFIGNQASLQIKDGVQDAIDDYATLVLEGSTGELHTKLVLDSDETVGRFVINDENQGAGVFSKKTHPEIISGNGKLTVE